MVSEIFLLLLLIDSGCCDGKNYTILHLGEDTDTDINDVIEKLLNYLRLGKGSAEKLNILSYHFTSKEEVQTVCENITSEVVPDIILDTTTIKEHAIVAEKIALSYGLPTFSTSDIEEDMVGGNNLLKKYDPEGLYIIKFRKPTRLYGPLIEKIVFIQGMTNVAIIYEPEFAYCKKLRKKFNQLGIISTFMLYSRETHNTTIRNVKQMYFQNILLVGNIIFERNEFDSGQVIYAFLVNNLKGNSQADVFFLPVWKPIIGIFPIPISLNEINIDVAFRIDLTLTLIMTRHTLDSLVNYTDSTCDNTEYPSRKDLNYRSIFIQNNYYGKNLFSIPPSRFYGVMVFNIHIAIRKNKTVKLVGKYSSVTHNITLNRENDLKSMRPSSHFKVLARVKPPFVYYNETTKKAFGYNIDLLDLLASILDFTYELTVIETHQSDLNPKQSGKSDGFISEMLEREMDIGLGPVYPSVVYRNVDFSIPYYKPIGIKFVMKRARDDSIFTFITVLETIVWVCILSAFFISSFMLWLAERISPYSYRNDKERYKDVEEVRDFTAKECLWFCLTSLTPQGGGIVPQHFSGRLVVVTWWLFGFIILASYTANLAAFLTLSKLKNPIESFTDLYRQFRMHYAPLNGSDEEAYFMNMAKAEETARSYITASEYPLPNKYSRMKQIILNSTYPNTIDEALEKVYASVSATEGFAFLVDSMDAKYLLMTRCNLIDIEEEVGKRPLVIALPKFTLLKYNIDKALTIIMERRLDAPLEKKWWDDNPYKATNCVELEDESEGIGIYNIGGVFLIIFIGIGIASLTITFDYFRYIRRQRSRVTVVTPLTNEHMFEDTAGSDGIDIPKRKEELEKFSKLQHRNVTRY